jgi:hypothetical protein
MAIIYNYPLNSILLAEDMLIGTSTKIVNGQPKNATKNFSIADLTGFIKQNVSLDDVLLVGNTSLLDAKIGRLYLYDTPIADYGNIALNQNRFSFSTVTHGEVFRTQRDMFSSFSSSGYRGSFEVSNITANRVWDFPDKSGTVALLSDVPVVTIPTLQQVTDEGNTTSNDIIVSKETGTSYIQVANNDNTLTLQVEGAFGSLIELNDYSANRYGLINSSGLNFEEFGYSNINLRDGFLTIANASLKPYISLNGSDGTLTGSVEIKTDLVDGTYIQQLPNASGTIALTSDITTPTLQEVLDNNHDLVDGNNFQGTEAGLNNTGVNVVAFGTNSAVNNTGDGVNAIGTLAASDNTGIEINAFGEASAGGNTGSYLNAFGVAALQNNEANHANAFGAGAGNTNIFKNVNLFGFQATADAENQTVFSKWISGLTKYLGRLSFNNITEDRKWELPDASGTIALTSDITTPTLQEVTDEGNETTNNIKIAGLELYDGANDNYSSLIFSDGSLIIDNASSGFQTYLDTSLQSDSRIYSLPDENGIIALLSDIPLGNIDNVLAAGNTATDKIFNLQASSLREALILYPDSVRIRNSIANPSIITWMQMFYNKITFTKEDQTNPSSPTTFITELEFTDPTANRVVTFQDASGTIALLSDIPTGGVTSVGLTMPSAFSVTNSPITSSGDIAVTALGTASQYIRGDGQLATLPTGAGGGSTVAYYLNGSINASVAGYKQLSNTATIGGGTDFTLAGNGLIAQFLTDIGNPNRLEIPGGAWNFEMFFQASSAGGSQKFYVELLKYDGTTFTSIASSVSVAEEITGGTTIDLYLTSLAVPTTSLLVTDRLAIRVYIVDNSGGRTITLHTEDNTLCEIITTFSGGVTSLNGLSASTQYFDVGTGATNFNISSSGDTHTFNLLFNIRRNANNSSNNNINYNGYAVTGSAESSAVWTITRLTIAASGSITVATATNVAWTNRESATYI